MYINPPAPKLTERGTFVVEQANESTHHGTVSTLEGPHVRQKMCKTVVI